MPTNDGGTSITPNNARSKLVAETSGNATPAEERLENRRKMSEIIKNAFEVIGGSIAGIWVLVAFGLKDCPNRETHFEETKGEFTWSPGPTAETCIADWTISIKNISSKSTDINHVEVIVWPLELPVPQGGKPGYLDFQRLRPTDSKQYLFSAEFDKGSEPSTDPFIDHYSPNSADTHNFEWIFNRSKDTARPAWIGLELALYENKGDKVAAWYSYHWSQLCPPEDTNPQQAATTPR